MPHWVYRFSDTEKKGNRTCLFSARSCKLCFNRWISFSFYWKVIEHMNGRIEPCGWKNWYLHNKKVFWRPAILFYQFHESFKKWFWLMEQCIHKFPFASAQNLCRRHFNSTFLFLFSLVSKIFTCNINSSQNDANKMLLGEEKDLFLSLRWTYNQLFPCSLCQSEKWF